VGLDLFAHGDRAGGQLGGVDHHRPGRGDDEAGIAATNWRAEQAIRPAVVTRKSRGGNRTRAGADAWQVLTSVLRTATQQGRDPIELLTRLLQAPTPIVADLAIPGR
jgi:transposase